MILIRELEKKRNVKNSSVTTILGARQIGKTTLAKNIIKDYNKDASLFCIDENSDIRLLIFGSVSPTLIRQSSESLAGRIFYNEIYPLNDFLNLELQ